MVYWGRAAPEKVSWPDVIVTLSPAFCAFSVGTAATSHLISTYSLNKKRTYQTILAQRGRWSIGNDIWDLWLGILDILYEIKQLLRRSEAFFLSINNKPISFYSDVMIGMLKKNKQRITFLLAFGVAGWCAPLKDSVFTPRGKRQKKLRRSAWIPSCLAVYITH